MIKLLIITKVITYKTILMGNGDTAYCLKLNKLYSVDFSLDFYVPFFPVDYGVYYNLKDAIFNL